MKLEMVVVYENGNDEKVTIRPVTQVAYERNFGKALVSLGEGMALDELYWLAWHAATKGAGSYDDWLSTVDEIDFGATPEPPAPFPEAVEGSS